MEKAKFVSEIVKNLTLLTQLGFSLAIPPLMCLGLCWWLIHRFGWSPWIYLPGMILGLGASWSSCMSLYRMVMKKQKKEDKNEKSFSSNRHL